MYNLSISFGPTGTVWAFLFKDKGKAGEAAQAWRTLLEDPTKNPALHVIHIDDDFGQAGEFLVSGIHSVLIEDLEQLETAHIQRGLAQERVKAKFMKAAMDDPVIRAAARGQQTPIMTPMGGGFRGN